MKKLAIIAVTILWSFSALADDATDQQALLVKALAALQAQRNAAQDDAVNARAQAVFLDEKLTATRQEVAAVRQELAEKDKQIYDLKLQVQAAKPGGS